MEDLVQPLSCHMAAERREECPPLPHLHSRQEELSRRTWEQENCPCPHQQQHSREQAHISPRQHKREPSLFAEGWVKWSLHYWSAWRLWAGKQCSPYLLALTTWDRQGSWPSSLLASALRKVDPAPQVPAAAIGRVAPTPLLDNTLELALRLQKSENWPRPLLIAAWGELAMAELKSSPWWWWQERAGRGINWAIPQVQNEGYV